MPTVPRLNRQVGTAPLPSTRQSPNAPAAAFGVASPIDLSGPTALVRQAKDHADQVAANAAELQLSDLHTALMTKVSSAQGVNALQAATDAQQEWQAKSSEIVGGLSSERVKQSVQARASNYWSHLYETTESHAAAEQKKADAQTTDALLTKGLRQVDQNPDAGPDFAEQARARVADFGRRNGWSPEVIAEKQAGRVSDIHAAAISRLVSDGTPEGAQKASDYLAKMKPELIGEQRNKAEQLVDAAMAQGAGFREADAILKQSGNPVADDPQQEQQQPITMAQALAKAEAIQDPRARKAATDQIVAHFSHMETAKRIDREDARASVLKRMEATGGTLNRADPAWLKIDGYPEGEQVLHRQEQLLKPAKDPGDPELFLSHLNAASISPASRTEFLRADFTGKDGEGLNTSQKTRLIQLQRQYRGQETRTDLTEIHRADAEDERLLKADLKRAETTLTGDELTADVQRINRFYQSRKMQRHGTTPGAAPSAPTTGSGDVSFAVPTGTTKAGGAIDPADPYGLAHLSAVEPVQPTPQMLDGAARNPAYAQYLRNMGVVLPKKLPVPVAETPKK